jgi:prepilin-type N-terminal cleavage/methylation domain-containing protein
MLVNRRGFTLIEVMIAITILAALTLLTSRAIRSGILAKEKFQGDINREAAVRDAIRVMERDINMAYHYRDINAKLINEAMAEAKRPPGATPTPPPTDGSGGGAGAGGGTGGGAVDQFAGMSEQERAALKKPIPQWTGFIGETKSLYFSSTSNVRLNADAQESDQAEIGYYTRNCKSMLGEDTTSTCLIRSVAPFIDDDLEKGGQETVLLENVIDFKLRYIGPGIDEWDDTWVTKTEKRTEGVELFPYAVEIYIKTHNKNDKKDKPFEMAAVAAIRFPNNDPKKEADAIANKK